MKTILFLVALVTGHSIYAQNVKITKKDGAVLEVKVGAKSKDALFYNGGSVKILDITDVVFAEENADTEALSKLLRDAGVTVSYGYEPSQQMVSPVVMKPSDPITMDQLTGGIQKFKDQRAIGKGLQLVGIAAQAAAITLQSIYNQKYQDDLDANIPNPKQKNVSPIIPIAGVAVFTIGIVVDLEAGKHLKFK